MVQRRKFLVGMGSLAAGGAAVMGTGAISVTNFERNLSVNIASDENAYLSLVPNSDYAEINGNQLVLDFGENSEGGKGLNENSDTEFRNVFRVENKGTNALRFQFFEGGDGSFGGDLTDTPLAIGVSDAELTYSTINDFEAVNTSASPVHWSGGAPAVASAQDIDSGEDSYVHIGFFLNDATDALNNGANNVSQIPNKLEIYAEALPETGPL